MEFAGKQSLRDYPEKERAAYIAAVASMATPEDKASSEEEQYLSELCDEAGLNQRDKREVIMEARDPRNNGFERYLDFLRSSDLKFSFVVDVLSYAKADGHYSEAEKKKIHRMADRLGISIEQYNALYEYVEKAEQAQGEESSQEGFLESSGLKQKFDKLNIPVKGLLSGVVGSMLMRGIMGRRRRGGILSRLMGGGRYRRRSGFSSIIGMLSGNRGYRRSGGLLSRLL